MSTDLIKEEDGKGYSLTRFAGRKGVMYQIIQDYSTKETEPGMLYLRGCTGYVCVSEQDLRDMLAVIEKEKKDFIERSLDVLKHKEWGIRFND